MVEANSRAKPRRRTASKAERRRQLIEATIECIAKSGFSDTTLSAVSKQAGLSQGIINLHFETKDSLLLETLRFIADDYKAAWMDAIARAGPSSADRLKALIEADFSKQVCDRRKLAVWFAFWGEAKSRPKYLKICQERDQVYIEMLEQTCAELGSDYEDINPTRVAAGIDSMVEGLWLDILMGYSHMTREDALAVCLDCLKRYFPKHY